MVHNHGLWKMPNVYAGWLKRRARNVKLVIAPRGTLSDWAFTSGSFSKRIFWTVFQKQALGVADCFHATSKQEYLDIRSKGYKQPIAVIPNGVEVPSLYPNTDSALRHKTLLFLGRIAPVKGIEDLLHAWSSVMLRYPDWRLKIVGPDDAGHLQKMRDLSDSLQLINIEFQQPVFGNEKNLEYQRADLFILPSHSENFGMSVAEALVNATPVIVCKGAPWAEVEVHAAGWWCDNGAEALRGALDEAMQLPASALGLKGARGREWMIKEFSWQHVALKFDETYDWLVRGGRVPDWVYLD